MGSNVICLVRSTHPTGLSGSLGRQVGGGEDCGEDLGGAGRGAGDQVVPGGRLGGEDGGARLVVGRVKVSVKRIVSAAFAFVLVDRSTHLTGLIGSLGRRAGGGEYCGEDLGRAGCGAGDQVVPDRVGVEAGGARSVVGRVKVSAVGNGSAAFAFVLVGRSTHPFLERSREYFSEGCLSVNPHHQRRFDAERQIGASVGIGVGRRGGHGRSRLSGRNGRWQLRLGSSNLLFLGCLAGSIELATSEI